MDLRGVAFGWPSVLQISECFSTANIWIAFLSINSSLKVSVGCPGLWDGIRVVAQVPSFHV